VKNPLEGIPALGGMGVPGLGVVRPGTLGLGGVPTEEGSLRGRARGGRTLEAGLEGMTGGLGLEGPGGLADGLGVLAAGLGAIGAGLGVLAAGLGAIGAGLGVLAAGLGWLTVAVG